MNTRFMEKNNLIMRAWVTGKSNFILFTCIFSSYVVNILCGYFQLLMEKNGPFQRWILKSQKKLQVYLIYLKISNLIKNYPFSSSKHAYTIFQFKSPNLPSRESIYKRSKLIIYFTDPSKKYHILVSKRPQLLILRPLVVYTINTTIFQQQYYTGRCTQTNKHLPIIHCQQFYA